MEQSVFHPDFEDLPATLPVFPLNAVLLLPRGQLPLNIFEPRYLAMVDEALRNQRMIGMIQPQNAEAETDEDNTPLQKIGCAGRITNFQETGDGRYEITLTGVCRFRIVKELPLEKKFREVKPAWGGFEEDIHPVNCLDLDKEKLTFLLKSYFAQEGLSCSWESVESAPDEKLITCLAMICPFGPTEKQALLESPCCRERARLFMQMLEMALSGGSSTAEDPCSCH